MCFCVHLKCIEISTRNIHLYNIISNSGPGTQHVGSARQNELDPAINACTPQLYIRALAGPGASLSE